MLWNIFYEDPKILCLKHYICPMPHHERQLDLKRMKEPKAKRTNTKNPCLWNNPYVATNLVTKVVFWYANIVEGRSFALIYLVIKSRVLTTCTWVLLGTQIVTWQWIFIFSKTQLLSNPKDISKWNIRIWRWVFEKKKKTRVSPNKSR